MYFLIKNFIINLLLIIIIKIINIKKEQVFIINKLNLLINKK